MDGEIELKHSCRKAALDCITTLYMRHADAAKPTAEQIIEQADKLARWLFEGTKQDAN